MSFLKIVATRLAWWRALAAVLPVAVAGCGISANDPNAFVQPQATNGPCTVKKFFLLSQTAVHTDMAINGAGQSCTFTVISPDAQAFPTASLLTRPAEHGRAQAGFANGGRSALITYTPQPGYRGADRFTVTIEPNDHAIEVAVTVQ